MAQTTDNPILQNQISAGTKGRKLGHSYEDELARRINSISMPFIKSGSIDSVIYTGAPEIILINKILSYIGWDFCEQIKAYPTGKLATSENGDNEIFIEGQPITSSKSDVILVLENSENKKVIGISIKQCNNKTPTNAQVFFSTATAFFNLVNNNIRQLSENALIAMKQFCGDEGFRPIDIINCSNRISSPERYFWEEVNSNGKAEWEDLFIHHQDEVTQLILQKAYLNDPFPPEIILHKTKRSASFECQEIAVFSIDQFIKLSKCYSSFTYSNYRVKKGRYKEPEGIIHQAPRFGVIQMQRGGQKQHPTQLQFNLKAGYFYELDKL